MKIPRSKELPSHTHKTKTNKQKQQQQKKTKNKKKKHLSYHLRNPAAKPAGGLDAFYTQKIFTLDLHVVQNNTMFDSHKNNEKKKKRKKDV